MPDTAYTSLAEVYDALSLQEQEAWLEAVPRILAAEGILPPSAVADVACGTGRLTAALANRGYRMVGADISGEMLEQAMRNAAAARVRFPLVQQDMRVLSLPKPAAALLCCCDGLNYLTNPADLPKAFKAFYKALAPGGLLLADVSAEAKLRPMDGQFYGLEEEAAAYLWSNSWEEASRCLTMDITLFIRERDGRFRREHELHCQRAHTRQELEEALTGAGFTDIRLTDGLTDAPAGEASLRLGIRAKKPS